MKRILLSIALCLFSTLAQADVINGSFEDGLTGWTPSLDYYVGTQHNPYPKEQVWEYTQSPPSTVSDISPLSPVDGNYVGRIYVLQGAPSILYPTITLSQSVQMSAGDTLSGLLSMGTFQSRPQIDDMDYCYVSINNSTIFSLNTNDAWNLDIRPDDFAQTPWIYWSWTAPEAGNYALSLNVKGDYDIDSWGYFDNIKLITVPEPSTIVLLGLGIVVLFVYLRIAQAQRKV